MGDGQTETMNRTIINMLKTLGDKEKKDWAKHLLKLTFAYNVTVNKTTGYSPYYLMFGRSPRLPIDSVFVIEPNEEEKPKLQVSYQKYVEEWEQAMNQTFNIAKKHSCSSGVYNKVYYNKKVRGVENNVGDKVLLPNHAEIYRRHLTSYFHFRGRTQIDFVTESVIWTFWGRRCFLRTLSKYTCLHRYITRREEEFYRNH